MTSRLQRHFPHALAGALAVGLAASLLARAPQWAALAAAAVAAGASVADARARLTLLAVALAAAGWWWGGSRLARLDASELTPHLGAAGYARAVVTGPARRGAFALRMPATLERFEGVAVEEPVLLTLPLGRAPPQGARIEVAGRLAPPRPGDGEFDETEWLRRQGVQVVVHGERWRALGRRGGVFGLADRLRAHVARTLAHGHGGDDAAVVAGVVLGADEGLPADLRGEFRASGLYHLLAVSGQNVGLIAGGVLVLGWLLGVARWLAQIAVLAAIAAYVLVVGLQPSVVRAGIAGALASLAWLAARPRDRWYFLLVAACVLLLWNPYSLLEPGFQLSFAAVAAIFVAVLRLERAFAGYPLPRMLAGVVAVSSACGAVTAPILWLQFGSVPLYSVPANALAELAVPPLLALGLLAAAISPVLPEAARVIVLLAELCAAYVSWCAAAVSSLPYAELSSGRALVVLGIAAAAGWVLARFPRRGRWYGIATAGCAGVLAAGCALQFDRPPPPVHGLRMTVLDVGQGDGILLQTARHSVLVDQGPPEADVARQLRSRGVRALSLIVLTHPQRDHVGGAARVLRSLRVRLALDPRLRAEGPEHRDALQVAALRGVRVHTARAGQTLRLGRLTLRVLWPRDAGARSEDPNLNAVVLHASYGGFDALLTADAESPVTLPLRPSPVEVLKVAHHGSADPGLQALLAATEPEIAVVSVGARNDYGHPRASTLAALRAAGAAVYRTDRDGAVTIETDGRRLSVRTER